MASTRRERRIKEYGLSEVYTSEDPVVDIVFVHGLNGSAYETWTTKKSDIFWPADLLPLTLRNQQLRVLTYGYDAKVSAFMDGTSKDKIHNHAEHLAGNLFANRNLNGAVERPIIFICHSLGGLVVKKCLTFCSRVTHEHIQHLRSIYVSTYGILFLGTPHNGSDIAKFGSLLQSICGAVLPKKFFDTSPQLINSLRTENEHLQIINRDFVQIMARFRIYFFHESKPMDLKTTRAFIVDESSAAPLMDGVERMGIEADHGGMCRFEDPSSPGYEAVVEAILRYSTDAPNKVPIRWAQEHRDRALEKQEEALRLSGLPLGLNSALGSSLISLHTDKFDSLSNSISTLLPNPPSEIGEIPRSQDPEKDRHIRVVPPGFHPNSAFFGMEKEFSELHKRLNNPKKRAIGTVSVLLYAGPGTGKSHLARQYMYTYQSLYPGGIFWIDCRTKESRYNGIWQIAQIADESAGDKESQDPTWKTTGVYVERARKWLDSREDWLLIFDDISFADSSEIDEFKNILPFVKNTAIIYTSVDRTLSKKHRLLEPYGIEVKRLSVPDACKLLYKDVGIKNPTPTQKEKAILLVNQYQCLPLAVHAVGHRLRASGRSLESYTGESKIMDEKLAQPFRDIFCDLTAEKEFEALNLIKILSFFGHYIPVGMIVLGRKALTEYSVEIRATDGGRHQRHIDTTFQKLIRYGLLDRSLYLYLLNDFGDSSSMGFSRISSDADDSHASDNEIMPLASKRTIDTVRIHTVVQGFCRDQLRDLGENHYYWWLAVATALFCFSYDNAKLHMRATRGSGLARDYREYLTHARRLMSHFPTKLSKVAISLQNLHGTLGRLAADMQIEIENRSPGSSQESFPYQKSIFDRTSSMSSVPDTPDVQVPISWEEVPGHIRSESPVDTYFPQQLAPSADNPHLQIPIVAEEPEVPKEIEEGSETSGMPSRVLSQNTETPQPPFNETDQGEWREVVKKPKREYDVPKSQLRRKRGTSNFGVSRSNPIVSVSAIHVESTNSPGPRPSIRSIGARSDAESALAAVHRSSPPPSRGGAIKPLNRAGNQKENQQSYAQVLANQTDPLLARRSAPSLNPQQTPVISCSPEILQGEGEMRRGSLPGSNLRTDWSYDTLSQSTHSDPGLVAAARQSTLPGHHHSLSSGGHSRNSSDPSQSHLHVGREVYGPHRIIGANPSPLPYQADVSISSYRPQTVMATSPSGFSVLPSHMVASIPVNRTSFPMAYMPTGYSSQPMSRDPSGQSVQSLRTEPARFPPSFSPVSVPSPLAFSDRSQTPVDTRHAQRLVFGPGELAVDSPVNSPQPYEAPGMSRGPSGPGIMINSGDGMSRSLFEFGRAPNTQHIQFGESNPVNVEAARRRARDPVPYPSHNLIPTASDDTQLHLLLNQNASPRQRSGSSPVSRQDLTGFGYQFQ